MPDLVPHQAPAGATAADQATTEAATGIAASGIGQAKGAIGALERGAGKTDVEGDDAREAATREQRIGADAGCVALVAGVEAEAIQVHQLAIEHQGRIFTESEGAGWNHRQGVLTPAAQTGHVAVAVFFPERQVAVEEVGIEIGTDPWHEIGHHPGARPRAS